MQQRIRSPSSDIGVSPTLIIGGVIAVLSLIFIFQNTSTGHVDFLWFDFEAPRWVWMILLFRAGMLTGVLVEQRRVHRKAAADT